MENATAISFKSESGNNYLELFVDNESPEQIIEKLKGGFQDEFFCLDMILVKSTNKNFNVEKLEELLNAFKSGEDFDEESKLLHIAHTMYNTAFLLEHYKTHPEGDEQKV